MCNVECCKFIVYSVSPPLFLPSQLLKKHKKLAVQADGLGWTPLHWTADQVFTFPAFSVLRSFMNFLLIVKSLFAFSLLQLAYCVFFCLDHLTLCCCPGKCCLHAITCQSRCTSRHPGRIDAESLLLNVHLTFMNSSLCPIEY